MNDDEREYPKGHIGRYYSIWCGLCSHWEHVGHYGSPTQDAKAGGWKLTKTDGWICAECYQKKKENR